MAALRSGPYLYWTRDVSANVWLRLTAPGTAEIRLAGRRFTRAIDASADLSGHVTVTGLQPSSSYSYEVWVDGVFAAGPFKIQTMPTEGAPGAFDVIFTTCAHEDEGGPDFQDALCWRHAAALKRSGIPAAFICAGDFETPIGANVNTDLATRRSAIDAIRVGSTAEKKAFLAATPHYNVWDDWDGGGNNNFGLDQPNRQMLTQVFREVFAGIPPGADPSGLGIYYSFKIADCLFLMVDDRTYSSRTGGAIPAAPPGTWDPETAQCWGPVQLQWIKDTLAANASAPFKFLINGTTMLDNKNPPSPGPLKRDSVGIYYRRERNDLMAWLQAHPEALRGLYLLTGDDHCQKVYYTRTWRRPVLDTDPNPFDEEGALYGPGLVEIKACPLVFPPSLGTLHQPWVGHPDLLAEGLVSQGALAIRINTRAKPARALFTVYQFNPFVSPSTPVRFTTIYEFWATSEGPSLAPKGQTKSTFTPGGPPSTPWTPIVNP